VQLLGISVPMGPQLLPALAFAELCRERAPELRVVLGGPTLSLMAEQDIGRLLRSNPAVDAVARYDGERPVEALARQAIDGDWHPHTVPGVSARRSGRTVHCPPAAGVALNDLPAPRYEPEILDKLVDPAIGIVQARGCYWGKCDYCDFVEMYEGSPRYRTRSAENFVDEMEYQVRRHGGGASTSSRSRSRPTSHARSRR